MLKANAGIYECIGQIYSIRDEEKFFAASGLLIIVGKRYRIIVTNHYYRQLQRISLQLYYFISSIIYHALDYNVTWNIRPLKSL